MPNVDNSAQYLGQLFGSLLFALLPLMFFRDGLRAQTASLRFANFALGCGLAFCILPEYIFRPVPRPWPMVGGVIRLGLGIAGIVFAVRALVRRRQDHGTGIMRPVLGFGFSGFHAFMGFGFAFLHLLTPLEADPATAWTYKDSQYGFEIKVPSDRWRQGQGPLGVEFQHPSPAMLCAIVGATKATDQVDFDAAILKHQSFLPNQPLAKSTLKRREGTTAQGNPYLYWDYMEDSANGERVFVATSVTFCKQKGVIVHMVFEGHPRMASQVGKESEIKSFHNAAEYMLLTVE